MHPITLSSLAAGIALALSLSAPSRAQSGWTNLTSGGPALTDAAMAYDSRRGVLVMTGGSPGGNLHLSTVYEWTGSAWSSRSSGTLPPHSSHRLTYDPVRHVVVLFGGWNGTVPLDQTWEYDGSTWTRRTPSLRPGPRAAHGMVWHPGRGTVLVFGGFCASRCALDDLWEWDGTSWTPIPQTNPPPARWGAGMVYDRDRDEIVLFGGRDGNGLLGDTWVHDGGRWTRRNPPGLLPVPRHGHVMTYDPVRSRVFLTGGYDGNAYRNDDWDWDGTQWRSSLPAIRPPVGSFAANAWHGGMQRTVTVGGYDGFITLSGTWAFGTPDPATVRALGSGCSGSNGTPVLTAAEPAWVGEPLEIRLDNRPLDRPCWLAIGASDTRWGPATLPLALGSAPFHMPGCTLYTSVDRVHGMAGRTPGSAVHRTSVPQDPALIGRTFYMQALTADPGRNPAGFITSGALAVRIGAL